jgi:hypothetical protein
LLKYFTTLSGTNLEISPPYLAISFTVLEEMKLYFGFVIKNTVVIDGANELFV